MVCFWRQKPMARPKPDDHGAPTDGTYSTETVAKFLNVAPSYLLELAAKRIVPRAIDQATGKEIQGRWRSVEANHAYIHYLREQAFGRGGTETDWRKEKTSLVKAQREKAQFELEVLRRRYVLAEDVQMIVGLMLTNMRARLMAFPGRYARAVLGLSTMAQATRVLEEAVRAVLAELRSIRTSDLVRVEKPPAGSGNGESPQNETIEQHAEPPVSS
jgi:hypothetical protein